MTPAYDRATMISDDLISDHYDQDRLLSSIEEGFGRLGKPLDSLTIDDLAAVDEFHTGGRPATEALLGRLDLTADMAVLDVGCGLGGPARYCATTFGCRVTGIDLTPSYIEAATALTGWVGLDGSVDFRVMSAQDLAFEQHTFDAAYLLHVGMNVEDKAGLFGAIAQVLRPGGRLAVYDLMRTDTGDLSYPLPWSSVEATSRVATPANYEAGLADAGFELVSSHDHSELAEPFIAAIKGQADGPPPVGGPPAVGLHLLMGDAVGAKLQNVVAALDAGIISPIEIIARTAA